MSDHQYLVDGIWVEAESPRHAAKYYRAVISREPDVVSLEDNSAKVVGWCENTGLAILDSDEQGKDYLSDEEGIMWLIEEDAK